MKSQTFGEKIKQLRLNLNYTLKFASSVIGCSSRQLSKIEKNEASASEQIIKGLSKLYKIPYKELAVKYLSEKVYYQVRSSEYAHQALEIAKKRLRKEGEGTFRKDSRDKILQSISAYFSEKPIEKAWVFGSFARSSNLSYDSDIDIMVVFKKPNKVSLFDLIEMKAELSQKTGRGIDLVEEGQELPSFRQTIREERLLIYGS